MILHSGGVISGRYAFGQLTSLNLGRMFTSRMISGFAVGALAGGILSTGAAISRAIYTARALRDRSPGFYDELRRMGSLDLLYFLVEDKVRPFEGACVLSSQDKRKFNQVCQYFFESL